MGSDNPFDLGSSTGGRIPMPKRSDGSYTDAKVPYVAVRRSLFTELQAALKPFIELADLTSGDEQALIPYSDSGYGYTASIKASDFDRLREISERIKELCP